MDCQAEALLPENLVDYLLRQEDTETTIRIVNNNLLLMSLTSTLNLLNTSHEEVWGAVRKQRPYLPVEKTMAKLLQIPSKSLGRGTLQRLFKAVPLQHNVLHHLMEGIDRDYVWLTADMWIGLFSSGFFQCTIAREFWIAFAKQARVLNAEQVPSEGPLLNQWKVYASATLVDRYGCPAMREVLDTRLTELTDQEADIDDPVLRQVHVGDQLAVLLRLLAWQVADIVVNIWDMIERDEMENIIPLDNILPRFDIETETWNNPIDSALENLAKKVGWNGTPKARTFLGNLWAQSESTEATEASSRIRLLRNWVQHKKGRPKFDTFLDLATAVANRQAKLAGIAAEGHEEYIWRQAEILRVAETLGCALQALTKLDFSQENITALMDVYRDEYRVARYALGKPMEA